MIKLNIIKYYNIIKYNKINKYINYKNKFIYKIFTIINLIFYEYIKNKLQLYNFKGIIIKINLKQNLIIILIYNNLYKNILFLYFNLQIYNLINIYKLGKLNLKKIKYLI